MLEIGLARADITCFVPRIGLMGWGLHHQKAEGVATPLLARALVVRSTSGHRVALVCCDLWAITQSVRQGVLDVLSAEHPELGLTEHEVVLTATHTHSAPGGYSHFAFYNASIPGFCDEVLACIVRGVVEAITGAHRALAPGRLRVASGEIPLDEPVAFNRSVEAYNRNPDVQKVTWERRHEATNRTMTVLRCEDEAGEPIGLLSLFAVHGTSVHSDVSVIHGDNKGIAAQDTERLMAAKGRAGFVAIFAQGAAGDVSPNFRWDKARARMVGAHDDDLDSAAFNGGLQAQHAVRLLGVAGGAAELPDALDSSLLYADFENVAVDPEHAFGRTGQRTSRAAIGLSMIRGTAEGWGPLFPYPRMVAGFNGAAGAVRWTRAALARLRGSRDHGWDTHRNKFFFAETGRGPDAIAFHLFSMTDPPLPGFVDNGVRYFRALARNGGVGPHPLTPTILPVQILRLGPLAIVAVPGEPTTVAGRRMEQTVQQRLSKAGVRDVVVMGYANAYAGYTTTREEYAAQLYEGGSTLFGQWTCAAHQTLLAQLADRMLTVPERRDRDTGPLPHRFSPDELARRAFPLY